MILSYREIIDRLQIIYDMIGMREIKFSPTDIYWILKKYNVEYIYNDSLYTKDVINRWICKMAREEYEQNEICMIMVISNEIYKQLKEYDNVKC